MKKLLTVVLQRTQPLSRPLLLASFAAGYILATGLLIFFSSQMHRLLTSLFF